MDLEINNKIYEMLINLRMFKKETHNLETGVQSGKCKYIQCQKNAWLFTESTLVHLNFY